MDERIAKRRWEQIFYNYRKDYYEKHRLEKKTQRIEEQFNSCETNNEKSSLREELEKTQTKLNECNKRLLKKYKLKKLPNPVRLKDEEFQPESLLPIIEVLSKDGDFVTIKIDRSYPKSVILKEINTKLKSMDLVEGKKYKSAGRPKLVDPLLVGECAQRWRDFYKTWQKHSDKMSNDYSKGHISNTTLSDLVMERLKEHFPTIEESTLNEYAKPYLMK